MKKMKMQEVLDRKDMSVEKGRKLDEVFATLTVDKKAKRLSSKQKAHLASQVDTSVENIQDYWLQLNNTFPQQGGVEEDLDKSDNGDDKADKADLDEVNKEGKREREDDNPEDKVPGKKRREQPPTTSGVEVKDGLDGVADNGDAGEKMEEVLLDQEGEGRRGEEESSDGRQSPPKSFCCEHCGRTFQHPSTLKRHVACHILPFSCVFCPDAFSRRGSLRIHLSKYHSVTNVDLHKYVPFSHLKYSDEEEVTLVRSIADKNAYERMNQSALWKALEEEEVLENRTARGMHSHFERDILPNIKTGKKSYGLAEKELSLFKEWGRKKKDVVEEEKVREEEKEGDGKSQGNLQFDYQESPYFREHPTAIAVAREERSMELFQNFLEGLEGYKVRTVAVTTEKGTIRQAHFLSPDGYILKTRRGVLEYLAVEGKTSLEAIVTIGRNVLQVSERKIDGFLNNWTEEIDATTFGGFSSDEDEAAKEEAERGDDTNLGLTCYTYIHT